MAVKSIIGSNRFWFCLIVLGLLAVYLPGLHNELIFDDVALLQQRMLWGPYGDLWPLKQRLLSYGSFVWVEALVGDGGWKQRLFNLLLHIGVVFTLYRVFKHLLACAEWPESLTAEPHFQASRDAALRFGVVLFAFNPVAVYAVAYLIQRSILAATLFVLLSCLAWLRWIENGRPGWLLAAVAGYGAAMLSKEHAVMTPLVWGALYVYICKPTRKRLAVVLGGGLVVLGAASLLLHTLYGAFIGVAFDPLSVVYMDQLKSLRPDIERWAWPLSMLNQAALFFYYGFLWWLPLPAWLSIDLRPAFPVSFGSFRHLIGAAAYVALLLAASWMLLRAKGPLRLLGLCLLLPMLLFASEFAMVWIQDPFVLYRSYLWAIAIPGIAVLLLVGIRPAILNGLAIVLMCVLAGGAFERVLSLKHSLSAWSDAVETVDLDAPENAVGRWRPYLNRGSYYADKLMPELAYGDYKKALALGERRGHANYNSGIALQLLGRYREAVEQFDQAEARGGADDMVSLLVNRGESHLALGNMEGALKDFSMAVDKGLSGALLSATRLKLAQIALATGRYDAARANYDALLQATPDSYDFSLGVALSDVGLGQREQAMERLEALLLRQPSGSAFYGKALLLQQQGDVRGAREAVDRALALEPGNEVFKRFRDGLAGD